MYFSNLANRSSALSIRQKSSGHPKGPRPESSMPFPLEDGHGHILEGQQPWQARPPNGSALARIPPTSGEQTPQRCPTRLPIQQCRGPWCLTMWVNLAGDDARSTQHSLATGERWEGNALSDLRQKKTQTQSHSGMPSSSTLTGRPKTAKKEGSGHPKGPAQNPFVLIAPNPRPSGGF